MPKSKIQTIKPFKEIIATLSSLKYSIEVDTDIYSEEEKEDIINIIETAGSNIKIDKTYVCYKGNKRRDAFIVEDKWYDLIQLVNYQMFSNNKKGLSKIQTAISCAWVVVVITYIYEILVMYGYSEEGISVDIKNEEIYVSYEHDLRTNWEN